MSPNLRHAVVALTLLAGPAAAQSRLPAPLPLPRWAYPVAPPTPPGTPPGTPVVVDDTVPRRVPGSNQTFSTIQVHDRFAIADWHPEQHAPMPPSVVSGQRPTTWGCGYCHTPDGVGRPENASLAGLPAAYIVRQVADFRDGHRRSTDPKMQPVLNMIMIARNAEDAAVREAAAYFSRLRPRAVVRVIESDSAPASHVGGTMLVATDGAPREPIDGRIIEIPDDVGRTELRDAASGYTAYVPTGSIKRGQQLVTRGAKGGVQACTRCHGGQLRGDKEVPGLAGRSPSYLVRQLHDFRSGARGGAFAEAMRQEVAHLSADDIVAIAAYLASRAP